jgi:2-polyprenyl-3-methyl-5-hydroxy-6-metoxy-1,4-benzoquinol methylase
LRYENMPATAQGFPDATTLAQDRGVELRLCVCAYCGLAQIPGPPVSYYREVIRAVAFSPAMREFRRVQFSAWIERHGLKGKSVLEVGCGQGEYLELLREAGAVAHGVEYAPQGVAACRRAGFPVVRAFIRGTGQILAQGPFPAFVTFNFMEHWPDPVASLRGIHDNLADDGIGLVEVPNFDMIARCGLYAEFIHDHLSYFTAATLAHTLRMAGFEVLEIESIWQDYILSATVRKRPALDMTRIHARRAALHAALAGFLARFPEKSVAVWGAGHQALAVIALSGIAARLKYVVDSAPFKQGKYTPATHLPIVPPSALRDDPALAVIIMAASYSDEVTRILRAQYDPNLPVVILRDDGLENT